MWTCIAHIKLLLRIDGAVYVYIVGIRSVAVVLTNLVVCWFVLLPVACRLVTVTLVI